MPSGTAAGFVVGVMLMLASQPAGVPAAGVPETLAQERARTIRDLRYDLTFSIPAAPDAPIQGQVVVRFRLDTPARVVLDFAQAGASVSEVRNAGGPVPYRVTNGHVMLAPGDTASGENEIAIRFTAGNEPLNRNDDFLYTLFVPARAHLAFPSFDQPDLKARFTLTLDVPEGWEAVGNGREVSRARLDTGAHRIRFAETEPLPTYLFSFVAGRFSVESAVRNGREFRMFHRETDPERVARNRDAIFDLHAAALRWLEDYTSVPYPFDKFDFVLVPSFQFGGMEHAGAILYNASRLLLEEASTQNDYLERASLIAHETSHMWFGNLVTMRWFSDVWMKEVFANFMAAKIVNPSFPELNHDVRFLWSHYPAAYQVDRTAGTNPIRQSLENLNEAGALYGPIIYQKAPIVMRQLELQVGEEGLRDGLREYLSTYRFGNASWSDLVRLLDDRTPADLAAWSRAWVEERGRPEFRTTLSLDEGGRRIERLALTLQDPFERSLVWPQRLRVALGYEGRIVELPVDVTGPLTDVTTARGLEAPQYVLAGGGGLGYGLFLLDPRSRAHLLAEVETIPDPLTRASAWITLWENLLEGEIEPVAYFDAALRALPDERDDQNVERLLGYVRRAFWAFLGDAERRDRSPTLEALLRDGLARAGTTSQKAAWFNAYRDTALSADALDWLTRVWRREERIPDLPLAEPDEITLALELAVREAPGWPEILREQHARTANPDRKARFAFVMPALSADPAERERAFERLRDVQNRRREPWAEETLRYLNHPLRSAHARRFVRPALDLLQEIRRTGDIFFPTRWMEATLRGHSSREAADIVRRFLEEHPEYPQRLRWTVLSTADELLRMAQ